jgi:hypothetical protein
VGRAALPGEHWPRSRSRSPQGCVASARWARFGVEPLLGRNYWPQGQLQHTLLPGNSQRERESERASGPASSGPDGCSDTRAPLLVRLAASVFTDTHQAPALDDPHEQPRPTRTRLLSPGEAGVRTFAPGTPADGQRASRSTQLRLAHQACVRASRKSSIRRARRNGGAVRLFARIRGRMAGTLTATAKGDACPTCRASRAYPLRD